MQVNPFGLFFSENGAFEGENTCCSSQPAGVTMAFAIPCGRERFSPGFRRLTDDFAIMALAVDRCLIDLEHRLPDYYQYPSDFRPKTE